MALCPGGRIADAQTAPVTYWIPGWPLGFGGNPAEDQSSDTYANFPGFDSNDIRGGGFSAMRHQFSNGWFVGGERSAGLGISGLSLSGPNQNAAFGNFGSLYTEGVQAGYNFQS